MSSLSGSGQGFGELRAAPAVAPWLVVAAGLAAMYLPVYWWAANGIWQTEGHAHGPIVLAVILWLFWQIREPLAKCPAQPAPGWGWPVFLFGLLVYFVGRALGISILEFGSQGFVLAGVLLLLKGKQALRIAWFPVLYTVFMVPLPETFVDAITGPLKGWISYLVVELLYDLGYPVARSGVVISIGQYQMLVADACSGLHSMYSLSALGLLFMYITKRRSVAHNAIMLACILPIAFVANITRVIILVLITYYFGDEAGQGFLHGTAGMVLMVAALLFLFLVDGALVRILREKQRA